MTRPVRLSVCAAAGCGVSPGTVSMPDTDVPAPQAPAAGAQACAGEGVTVSRTLTRAHRDRQGPALPANPAHDPVAVVASGSLLPLPTADLLRPLDDLAAAHGQGLRDSQLVGLGGQVVAAAFLATAQHLFYRADIREQAGVEPPRTPQEMPAAAGMMQHPVAIVSGAGWNAAPAFNTLFLGFGGRFFQPGSAAPALDSPAGAAALEGLKALTSQSDPDVLSFDSNAGRARRESGQVALALPGARARRRPLSDGALDRADAQGAGREARGLPAGPRLGRGDAGHRRGRRYRRGPRAGLPEWRRWCSAPGRM